ncbi:MAG: hypothetical protein QXM12_06305 [Nitrososphaerota archaeon]
MHSNSLRIKPRGEETLTRRQVEFLMILAENGGWMYRDDMRRVFGLGTDNVSLSLKLKGYIHVLKDDDGRIKFVLRDDVIEGKANKPARKGTRGNKNELA